MLPFLFLPYRWLWLPCALGATRLMWPAGLTLRERLGVEGNLIVGPLVILFTRTCLDIGWWLPWLAVVGMVLLPRVQQMGRTGRATVVGLVWVAAILLLWRPEFPRKAGHAVSPSAVLVCAGDSLTSGVDLRSDVHTYVAALRKHLGCKVINAGFANDKARDLLRRLDRDVIQKKPDVVLLFIGGNDYLDSTPRCVFAEQFESIARRISAGGASLVVVEVPTGIIWNPLAGIYRQIARRYGAVLVPETRLRLWFSVELLMRDRLAEPLTIDGIHLSPFGAERVADWLEPYVRSAIQSDRR